MMEYRHAKLKWEVLVALGAIFIVSGAIVEVSSVLLVWLLTIIGLLLALYALYKIDCFSYDKEELLKRK